MSASATPPDHELTWPNIAALLASAGHITVGRIAHVRAAAIAADEHAVLVAIVRREGESIQALLERLEAAIGRALYDGQCTNEIEGGHFELSTVTGRKKKTKRLRS